MYEKNRKRKKSAKSPGLVGMDSMNSWEIEEDLRAYIRAEAIRKDPERLKKVQELAKSKLDEYKGKKEEAQQAIDLGEQAKA